MGNFADGVASANDYLAARRAESDASNARYAASRAESRALDAESEVRRLQSEVKKYSSALATMKAVEAGYYALCTAYSEAAADPMNPTMALKNQRSIVGRAREIVANSQSVDPIAIQRAWRSDRMQKINDRFKFIPPDAIKPPEFKPNYDLQVPPRPGEVFKVSRTVAWMFEQHAWEFDGKIFRDLNEVQRAKAEADAKYARELVEFEEKRISAHNKAQAEFALESQRYNAWLQYV